MLSKDIPHILKEHYQIQPSLREREDEIIKVITIMKENSPKLEIDDDFRISLRKKLFDEAEILQPMRKKYFPDWRIYYPIYFTAFASFFIVIVFWGFFGKDIDTQETWSDVKHIGWLSSGVSALPNITSYKNTNGIDWENTTQNTMSLRDSNTLLDTPKTSVNMEQISMKQDYLPMKITQSWLTEEARRIFRSRLEAIPLEKKASKFKLLETQIMRQMDAATVKWNNKLVAKLQDILDIIHEEQGNIEDNSHVNDVILWN